MRLVIANSAGEKFALEYDPEEDTVLDLKLAVQEEWGIEIAAQRMLYGGTLIVRHFYNFDFFCLNSCVICRQVVAG